MDSINERLATFDGWSRNHGRGDWSHESAPKYAVSLPDLENDWNALKRIEGRAMLKSGHAYIEALFKVRGADTWRQRPLLTAALVLHASKAQVAEAVLAVLED